MHKVIEPRMIVTFGRNKGMKIKQSVIQEVSRALVEDIGTGDVTSALISAQQSSKAKVITRETMVIAGKEWFSQSILALDPTAQINWQVEEGALVSANQVLCYISANSRALLTAERTGLNFLQLLSAVATKTHAYVSRIKSNTKVLDSRKTLPHLRAAQKYAVRCGGGHNHRMGLYDAFLIKENHIKACGSIALAVNKAKQIAPHLPLEVEVESLDELAQALTTDVDTIMLDNFSIPMIEQALIMRAASTIKLEASGNVSLETIEAIANTGVDYISIGDLTKSVTAIDLSLLITEVNND